jgi:hypothetical protein
MTLQEVMKDRNTSRKENRDEEVFTFGIGFWACFAGFFRGSAG